MSSILEKVVLDERLSLKAKGLFVLLYTSGSNTRRAISMSKDGRDAHYAAFAELRELDYVQHLPCTENPDKSSEAYPENPETPDNSCTENPETEEICTDNPDKVEKTVSPLDNPPSQKDKEKTTTSSSPKEREKGFRAPKVQEVEEYMVERGWKAAKTQAQGFIDFYESKGWMIGKNKMKNWKAAVRTWERSGDVERVETPTDPKTARLFEIDWSSQPDERVVKASVYCVANSVNPPKTLVKRYFNNLKLDNEFKKACKEQGLQPKMLAAK
jgi:hypothetical protein